MPLLDYTGYAAALCTTGAYVPQVLRVWRTRSTKDISLKMFLVLVTGLSLWLVYGIWRGEIPLVAANGVHGHLECFPPMSCFEQPQGNFACHVGKLPPAVPKCPANLGYGSRAGRHDPSAREHGNLYRFNTRIRE